MSVAITIVVTDSSALTVSTMPPAAGTTTARTMAATDQGLTDLRDDVKRKVIALLQGANPNPAATVTATVAVA